MEGRRSCSASTYLQPPLLEMHRDGALGETGRDLWVAGHHYSQGASSLSPSCSRTESQDILFSKETN